MSVAYLLNQVKKLASNEKKNDTKDALIGVLTGKFEVGSRKPDMDYPEWTSKKVAPGGFYAGIKYELKSDENNVRILNDPKEMLRYSDLIEYIDHNLEGPEPTMIPTIGFLRKNGKIEEANKLEEIIRPYVNNIRFYPIEEELMKEKKKPNVFASLETISDFKEWCRNSYIYKLEAEERLINIYKKNNEFKNKLIKLFRETTIIVNDEEWPMQRVSEEWLEKGRKLYNSNKWYLYDLTKRKRGSLYNLWLILGNIILQPKIMKKEDCNVDMYNNRSVNEFAITRISGKEVRWIKVYLKANKSLKSYNITELIRKQDEARGLLKYLDNINEERLEKNFYEELKERFKDVEEVVFKKLNKCVLYPLEELKSLGYIPSGETFVELSGGMEAFLNTVDIDFKEDIAIEEHLKYIIYKGFKNMRSLLLLNLESQLKLCEIPQYKVLCDVYKCNKRSSNKLILSKLLVSYYINWFPEIIMPNRVVKMLYNLLKCEEKDLGLCEEIACDIFMGRFGEKYDTSLNIAQRNMCYTLYSKYYNIDKYYVCGNSNLTKLSLELKEQYYGVSTYKYRNTNENGQQLQAALILTTHNNIQLDRFVDELDVLKILKTITFKLLNTLEGGWMPSLSCSEIGHCWRNFMYYVSKCSMCEISKYLYWVSCKVIWNNICNNNKGYLNIEEEQPLFVKEMLDLELNELSKNNKYVRFVDVWNKLKIESDNEIEIFEKFSLVCSKYLLENKQNGRFFGLFISSLVNNSIEYYGINKYNNIFNDNDIILGWIKSGETHLVNNSIIYSEKFKRFKSNCEFVVNKRQNNRRR